MQLRSGHNESRDITEVIQEMFHLRETDNPVFLFEEYRAERKLEQKKPMVYERHFADAQFNPFLPFFLDINRTPRYWIPLSGLIFVFFSVIQR